MKVRLYTDKEIDKLKQCMFVRSIKYKREIEYDPLFKLWTIMMKHDFPELTAREIFARGGFDINILHKKLPQRRIKEWIDNYKKFGIRYFLPENEYYQSITYIKDNKVYYDSLKIQLMDFVLNRLKEIDLNDNR
ncbi:MAG: hypothetical protein ACI310_00575 [Bacilli bacterium]